MSRVRVRRRRAGGGEREGQSVENTRDSGYAREYSRAPPVPSAAAAPRCQRGTSVLVEWTFDDYNSISECESVLRRLRSLELTATARGRSGDAGYGLRGMIDTRPMCDRDDVAGPRPRPRPCSASPRSEPSEDAVDKEGNPNANRSLNVQRAGATEPNGARFTSRPVVEVVL